MSKIKNILYFLLILAIFFVILYSYIITDVLILDDEIWNFQNIYKMFNNLEIYNNANVIITPLFFYLGKLIFKILGASILTFRIYNILIFSLYVFLIYCIFRNLNISRFLSFAYLSLIFSELMTILFIGANYNTLAICFVFIGILLYLKCENSKYSDFLQALIIYLIFLTKQNIGFFYLIACIIYEFSEYHLTKKFIKKQFTKFIVFMSFLSITLAYFYNTGTLYNFFNYVFGGLLDFGHSNTVFVLYAYDIFWIVVAIVFTIISIVFKNYISNYLGDKYKKIKLLHIFSLAILLNCFPICNNPHFAISFPLFYILFFYILHEIMLKDILDDKKIKKILYYFFVIILLLLILRIFIQFNNKKDEITYMNNSNIYYGIPIKKEIAQNIDDMSNYIRKRNAENVNVIIIASDSAFTMINLKQNNNEFDLVFNGNLGYNGNEKVIEKIKKMKNTEFLIYTDKEDMFWQEPMEIRNYIINNLEKTGEISNYSIYINK